MIQQIKAHGGILINREINSKDFDFKWELAKHRKKLEIDDWTISDLHLIAIGAYSPLIGFLEEEDYVHVLEDMRLKNGIVWTIPITLAIEKNSASSIKIGDHLTLVGKIDGIVYATIEVRSKYEVDQKKEAFAIYKPDDLEHPGVKKLLSRPSTYIGGPIELFHKFKMNQFQEIYYDPKTTREIFKEKGWKTIVGFQTRNPIHRAHEYIQKTAMEIVDGMLLHPLVGETKSDDIPAAIRINSYQILLKKYYPEQRTLLSVFPAAMRYAGPREAVFHALVRKNYGCTHFIVGRDHAGVGNYYGTYDAQEIFREFNENEIEITPLFFEHSFYCQACGNMATSKTCPHHANEHIHLSGTKVRELLKNGVCPPSQFTRKEVAEILIQAMKNN